MHSRLLIFNLLFLDIVAESGPQTSGTHGDVSASGTMMYKGCDSQARSILIGCTLSSLCDPAVRSLPENRGPDNRCGTGRRGCGAGHLSELVFVGIPASMQTSQLLATKPKAVTPLSSSELVLGVYSKRNDRESLPQQGSCFLLLTTQKCAQRRSHRRILGAGVRLKIPEHNT